LAVSGLNKDIRLFSVDEKTGIQALERKSQPLRPGRDRRVEYEYKRHGTTTLMAAQDVATGQLISCRIHPTRTEPDFLCFIQLTTAVLQEGQQAVFLVDQLNTHMSASLVEWVASQIGYVGDLGVKGKSGVLKSKSTRKAFLEAEHHAIRFLFTPKHCSWLNPIENWFGHLQRKALNHQSFDSIESLTARIENFTDFLNCYLGMRLMWLFFVFDRMLENKIF
jgi:hypothetical protein